jgi:hypothetical protein
MDNLYSKILTDMADARFINPVIDVKLNGPMYLVYQKWPK